MSVKNCFPKFLPYLPWAMLIAGSACLFSGLLFIPKESILQRAALELSNVLLVGGLLGFMTKSSVFTKAIEKELEDIIYGKKFIKNRKDISDIWGNVSKLMFKNKFPQIHKEFLSAIQGYLPSDAASYYNNFSINISVAWEDIDKNIVKTIENVSFDLIADSEDEIKYPLMTWTNVKDKNSYKNDLRSLTVNGSVPKIKTKDTIEKDGSTRQQTLMTLKGKTKYQVRYEREKIYNISDDFFIAMRALYITNGLTVTFSYPEHMNVMFTCRGTQEDFEDIPRSGRCFEKKYEHIILPRQGYVFILQRSI